MTVYELIQELAKYPAGADVGFMANTDSCNIELDDVEIEDNIMIVLPQREIGLGIDSIEQRKTNLPVILNLSEVK